MLMQCSFSIITFHRPLHLALVWVTVVEQCVTEMVTHCFEVGGAELVPRHLPKEGATERCLHGEAVCDTHLSPHHHTTSTLLREGGNCSLNKGHTTINILPHITTQHIRIIGKRQTHIISIERTHCMQLVVEMGQMLKLHGIVQVRQKSAIKFNFTE